MCPPLFDTPLYLIRIKRLMVSHPANIIRKGKRATSPFALELDGAKWCYNGSGGRFNTLNFHIELVDAESLEPVQRKVKVQARLYTAGEAVTPGCPALAVVSGKAHSGEGMTHHDFCGTDMVTNDDGQATIPLRVTNIKNRLEVAFVILDDSATSKKDRLSLRDAPMPSAVSQGFTVMTKRNRGGGVTPRERVMDHITQAYALIADENFVRYLEPEDRRDIAKMAHTLLDVAKDSGGQEFQEQEQENSEEENSAEEEGMDIDDEVEEGDGEEEQDTEGDDQEIDGVANDANGDEHAGASAEYGDRESICTSNFWFEQNGAQLEQPDHDDFYESARKQHEQQQLRQQQLEQKLQQQQQQLSEVVDVDSQANLAATQSNQASSHPLQPQPQQQLHTVSNHPFAFDKTVADNDVSFGGWETNDLGDGTGNTNFKRRRDSYV